MHVCLHVCVLCARVFLCAIMCNFVCMCVCMRVCIHTSVCMCHCVYECVVCVGCYCVIVPSSGEHPTLPELLRLGVPQEVGANYSMFGIFLLNDKTGSQVDSIEDAYSGKPERITRKILQEWIGGKGLPLTWETLVQTLRDTGLSTLADKIVAKRL